MLLENFIISSAIFAHWMILVHCTQDSPRVNGITMISGVSISSSIVDMANFACIFVLYGLSHKKSSGIFFRKICPGYFLEIGLPSML